MNWDGSNLGNLPERIWQALGEAPGLPASPWRTPVFATTNRVEPSARVVVLRRADPEYRHLVCFSDVRAAKVRELRSVPEAVWLFHDPGRRVQVRATTHCMVHRGDGIAREHWDRLPERQKLNYCAREAPGGALLNEGDGIPDNLRAAGAAELEAGYANFAVIVGAVDQFDWLQLRDAGHRRAVVRWTGEKYSGIWLVP